MIGIENIGFEYEGCGRLRDLPFLGTLGETEIGGMVTCKRKQIYADALALFGHMKNRLGLGDGASVLVCGCGAREILTAALAVSMLGASLTLSETAPLSMSGFDLIISPRYSKGRHYISSDELSTLILGERWTVDAPPEFSHRTATFGFISKSKGREHYESYGERTLLTVGAEYLAASSLLPSDKQLSVLSPSSRDGFIFGLLAPAMIGAASYYSPPSPTLIDRIRAASPTRLLCTPSVARGLSDSIKRSDTKAHRYKNPIVCSNKPYSLRAVCNRIRKNVHERLLSIFPDDLPKAVTVIGDLPSAASKSLLNNGIYHISVLSFPGCPLAGYRDRRAPEGVWYLSPSLTVDMCNVQAGGIGSLTFRGSTVADGTPVGLTFSPWQYRREIGEKASIVSDLYGFSLKNNRFFVKGRVNF